MPKLPADRAKEVAGTETGGFEAIPEGPYAVTLREVKVSEKEGPSGFHYWSWELEVADGEYKNRRLWMTTSLSPKADFAMKQVFDAFGYSADSDTDEMIGEMATAYVSQSPIPSGARAGEISNNVDRLVAYNGGDGADLADEEPF